MNNPVLTTEGLALLNKALVDKSSIKFSSMSLSDNSTPKMKVSIDSYNFFNDSAYVTAIFTNEELTSPFDIKVLNVYAIDTETNTEVIYATSLNTTGDTFVAFSSGYSKKIFDLYVGFSQTDNVEITLDTSSGSATLFNVANQMYTLSDSSYKLSNTFDGGLSLDELQGRTDLSGSPSVTTPPSFTNVGDSGNIIIANCNKNLLPRTTKSTTTINGITYTMNPNGSITLNGTSTNTSDLYVLGAWNSNVGLMVLKKSLTYSLKETGNTNVKLILVSGTSGGYQSSLNPITFTPPSDYNLTCLLLRVENGTTVTNLTVYPQLELGFVSTDYMDYEGQLVNIALSQPLRSVDKYCDKITRQNRLWKIEENIIYIIFDGSADEDWTQVNTNTVGKYRYGIKIDGAFYSNTSDVRSTCNRFSLLEEGGTFIMRQGHTISYDGNFMVYYDGSDLATFRTWLQTNPILLQCVKMNPTYKTLSRLNQKSLNSLKTFEPVTNLFTNDPKLPIMKITYGNSDTSAQEIETSNEIGNIYTKDDVDELIKDKVSIYLQSDEPVTTDVTALWFEIK